MQKSFLKKKKKKELYGIFAFDHVINIRLHTSLTMFKSKAFWMQMRQMDGKR